MTLCLFVEDGVDPGKGPALHTRMVAHRPDFTWLTPPLQQDVMTVADVLTAQSPEQHYRLVHDGRLHSAGEATHASGFTSSVFVSDIG